jgi:uncharacterized protein YbjQ (UPF0145 family)
MSVHNRIPRKNIFTTSSLPKDLELIESFGLITHQNVSKAHVFHTVSSNNDNRFSLKHDSYEHVDYIMTKFLQKAPEHSNAVIGFKVETTTFSNENGFFILFTYYGTAVKLKHKK